MCGYFNDSKIFWHKFEKFDDRWRLVSTEVEVLSIEKFILNNRIVELYFEHLGSYIEADSGEIIGHTSCTLNQEHTKCGDTYNSDEFEDSENELYDDDVILERHGQKNKALRMEGNLLTTKF